MKTPIFDAIVIGSGIAGGWAAKELTERGLRTLLIERGSEISHPRDYKSDFAAPWELQNRGLVPEALAQRDYPVQSKCYAFNEQSRDRFVNDREHPYEQVAPFDWIRGYQTGGRSMMWGRQCYRWSELDFTANYEDGHGTDWPIRYQDLAPWYDHVEAFAGISGNRDGLAQIPDGNFQPPMAMNCVEKAVKARIEKAFPDRRLIIGRAAHLTAPEKIHTDLGRGKCMNRNMCEQARGCSFGAYFSTPAATLPAARRTGRLEMVHDMVVREIIFDRERGRASGVRAVERDTLRPREFQAHLIFLCAGTLPSTQIMLNSVSEAFPNGIGNGSGVLGRYLMDHHMRVTAAGIYPGFEDHYYSGRRPNGIYIPRFRNLGHKRENYLRGFAYQGGGGRAGWRRGASEAGFGVDFKRRLRMPGPWYFYLSGFGEMLPRRENRVWLDPEKRDRWGMPLLHVEARWSENEYRMREDMLASAVEMLEAAGLKNINSSNEEHAPGLTIHEAGTARMGRDPKTSVLNAYNQCHQVPNLFVTDGASLASSPCQNPSLTLMALTARAVAFAVKKIRQGQV
ncbi:GMC family oxidoreductase [Microbulbifer thermotolerans]|uniref:GMC oxidoreductase n=1 Tax=Microbulbifer thermotolerans TaxID=252514 RepID=UPI00224B5E0F|nr:GMC family oxidoreductase [Microbulbifer thermotolerans]MCX2783072.1 GMC family oxidoreductase [Microbulbifer thermotolerans]